MWYTALKNLSKCFITALVSYEAALLDGLSITATVVTSLRSNTICASTLRCVHFIHSFSIPAAPKMAPVKRHAYEADFKLNAISHAAKQVS